jgi:hypothetical protein
MFSEFQNAKQVKLNSSVSDKELRRARDNRKFKARAGLRSMPRMSLSGGFCGRVAPRLNPRLNPFKKVVSYNLAQRTDRTLPGSRRTFSCEAGARICSVGKSVISNADAANIAARQQCAMGRTFMGLFGLSGEVGLVTGCAGAMRMPSPNSTASTA